MQKLICCHLCTPIKRVEAMCTLLVDYRIRSFPVCFWYPEIYKLARQWNETGGIQRSTLHSPHEMNWHWTAEVRCCPNAKSKKASPSTDLFLTAAAPNDLVVSPFSIAFLSVSISIAPADMSWLIMTWENHIVVVDREKSEYIYNYTRPTFSMTLFWNSIRQTWNSVKRADT